MFRYAVVLLVLVALAAAQAPLPIQCTQNRGNAVCFELDDLSVPSGTTQRLTIPGPAQPTTVSSTVCSNTGAIIGGVREIKLENLAPLSDCDISARVGSFQSGSGLSGLFTFSRETGCGVNSRATLRLDGEGNCNQASFSESFQLIPKSQNTPLSTRGNAFEISAGSDIAVDLIINVYGSSASEKVSKTIRVPDNSDNAPIDFYLPFDTATFGSNAATVFGTSAGAIEIIVDGGSNQRASDTSVFFFDIVQPVVEKGTITGRIFDDCGCNGQGATDLGKANIQVSLTASAGCQGASSATALTNSQGDYTFADLPGTCTYTVSVSGLTLCPNSGNTPTRSNLPINSVANFDVQVSAGVLTRPDDVTVGCGDDTSVAALGTGRCSDTCSSAGQGTVTHTDTVQTSTCTAPGGVLTTILRAWTGCGTTLTQTIRITDRSLAPTFDNFPADISLDCNAPLPTASATATGRCTTATVTHTDANGSQTCSSSCTLTTTVTRTYTAVDVCGNTASRPQIITRTACAGECPECPTCDNPPIEETTPSDIFTGRANCVLICDDDESSASTVVASALLAVVLAVLALF